MTLHEFVTAVHGGLIVSCQAGRGHPMRNSSVMARFAEAAELGGAVAIRCGGVGGPPDVAAVSATVSLPIIGLTKTTDPEVYITPTVAAARAIIAAGADVVACDATARESSNRDPFADIIDAVHACSRLVMADVATADEGVEAARAGADIVATTLAGYTTDEETPGDPDLCLVEQLRRALPSVPLVAEGRYHTPAQVAAAFRAGATAVVVGTAITDPVWITQSFVAAATGRTATVREGGRATGPAVYGMSSESL